MMIRSLNDRFSTALLMAIGVHALALLAVGFFVAVNPPQPVRQALDVVLVNWRSEKAPDDADFLAQASQEGGGEASEPLKPSAPESGVLPNTETGDAPINAQAAQPETAPEQDVITAVDGAAVVQQEQESRVVENQPTSAELITQAMQMARLEPEISDQSPTSSKQTRRKFVSPRTKEYGYAAYISAWESKVERIGQLNYPQEARRRDIYGALVLTVGINQDGSLESVFVQEASGHAVLDQAAIAIVKMAAPYAPLPDNIRQEVDVLHITREWKFTPGHRLIQ